MNKREKTIMWTSILAPVLIIVGVALLVLGSLPVENRLGYKHIEMSREPAGKSKERNH